MDALKTLLVKKPFVRISHESESTMPAYISPNDYVPVIDGMSAYNVCTQSQFLREYYPSGHRINSPVYYPDRIQYDPDKKVYYRQPVVRASFAFQQVIALKHTITLCGNDIQFSLTSASSDENETNLYNDFVAGWETHDMEIAWYELVKSAKITGDGAIVGYINEGKFRWKSLSFLNGDTLYPHYDAATGRISSFLRRYSDINEEGNETIRYVEMWDSSSYYLFRQQRDGLKGLVNKTAEKLGLDGYELIEQRPHGFPFCPVAYIRLDGPCWMFSQDTIEQYELSFSYLCQNNMAFAFPIMYLKGDDISVSGEPGTSSVKVLNMDSDAEAGFLTPPDGSSFLTTELTKLYDMILEQSFVAKPPEVKSGDLPASAIKLLYSPAIERAMEDASVYKRALNAVVRTFKFGFGLESETLASTMSLPISFYIEPYVHHNDSELIESLATAVGAGFLSIETAAQRARVYTTPQEFDRIMREYKQKNAMDLVYGSNENRQGTEE